MQLYYGVKFWILMSRTARAIARKALNMSCILQGNLFSADTEFSEEVTVAVTINLKINYI